MAEYLVKQYQEPCEYVRFLEPPSADHIAVLRGDLPKTWIPKCHVILNPLVYPDGECMISVAQAAALSANIAALRAAPLKDLTEFNEHPTACTALHIAAGGRKCKNRLAAVKTIVERDDFAIDVLNKRSVHCLYPACESGHDDIVRHIVALRPQALEIVTVPNKCSPLFAACYNGKLETTKILLEMQPSLMDCVNVRNTTVFGIACQRNHLSVVTYLNSVKPTLVDVYTDHNTTSLYFAAMLGHLDIVKYLISIRPTLVNQRTADGQSPLVVACRRNHVAIVEALVAADLGEVDKIYSVTRDQKFSEEVTAILEAAMRQK
jgi:hypothetical protein